MHLKNHSLKMIKKDLKVAVIGNHPVVRITTDEGVDGIAAAESSKPYLKPMIEFYKEYIQDIYLKTIIIQKWKKQNKLEESKLLSKNRWS